MFFLVPAYPGCPGQTAVKWLLLLLFYAIRNVSITRTAATAILRLLYKLTCVGQHLRLRTGLQEDFVGAKFYGPHARADDSQRIGITEKMLEFSSTGLSTSPSCSV